MNTALFSKLQNGFLSNKSIIIFSIKTKFLKNFLNILLQEGYIYGYKHVNDLIYVYLKYNNNRPTLTKIKKYPKNTFQKLSQIIKFKNSIHLYIFTTPQGLVSHKTAILLKTGGSLLCKIY